jgi:hypothetical protein
MLVKTRSVDDAISGIEGVAASAYYSSHTSGSIRNHFVEKS